MLKCNVHKEKIYGQYDELIILMPTDSEFDNR